MSSGPENRFIHSLHRKLDPAIYPEKMNNPYRGGTFDVWYSGKYDLWVEYKWLAKLPKKGKLVPALSDLQQIWGRGRYKEGRNVAVIVGYPGGGVIFTTPSSWERGKIARPITKIEVIEWLKKYCLESSLRQRMEV